MELTRVDDVDAFVALRDGWEAMRRDDPHATVFQSWEWLYAFCSTAATPWSILLLRDGATLVAALPVSLRGAPHARLAVARDLTFATDPFADYQAMLCRAGSEPAALAAFVPALRAMPWDRARFRDVADPRIEALLRALCEDGTALSEDTPTACSLIDLPASWDAYLGTLSKPTRRATLRLLRALGTDIPDGRITNTSDGDADRHIDAMITVNGLRWGSTPQRNEHFRRLFRATLAQGCLHITIIWDGDRPIAGGAAFVDRDRSVFGAYMVGHDPAYGKFSPGRGILGIRIREAITEGYATFDFMRGGESYKSSYATRERQNRHFTLVRRGPRTTALRMVAPLYEALRRTAARVRMRRASG